jgi:hypothetical protein
MVFRLVAARRTHSGTITGTVSAGTAMSVDVTVNVAVTPPPKVDKLRLTARLDQWNSWWSWLWNGSPVLDITATNTGTSTKPVTVTVDRAGSELAAQPGVECTGRGPEVSCVTKQPLKPHQSLRLLVRVYHLHPKADTITVNGTLGTATASAQVDFRPPTCAWLWCWPAPPGHHPPSSTPTRPSTGGDTTPPTDTKQSPSSTVDPTTTTTAPPTKPSKPTRTSQPPVTTTVPPTTEPSTPDSSVPPSTQDSPPPSSPSCPSGSPKPGQVQPGLDCLPLVPALFSLLGPL